MKKLLLFTLLSVSLFSGDDLLQQGETLLFSF